MTADSGVVQPAIVTKQEVELLRGSYPNLGISQGDSDHLRPTPWRSLLFVDLGSVLATFLVKKYNQR